ncbi:pro-MCH [Austrofundulus limnaeus]|uniref:Pro-MCH n=1 Tax=Austrofundulus limnaeus TaxID=52670 RepID=A0A2I4CMT2_AUSLI|nr:PREDICTED: pro-MCH 2-like [Austrofundulus limnaeus]
MMSVFSVLFTLVLFSDLNSHLVTAALFSAEAEDVPTADQESLDSVLGDETMAEPVWVPTLDRRNMMVDNIKEDGTPKILIISGTGLRGHGVRGLNPTISRSRPLIPKQTRSHVPDDFALNIEKREKDLDMLRCMIGRVYRPCWETKDFPLLSAEH